MANPITQFIESRFVLPTVEKALSANHPPAYSTTLLSERSLTDSIGQPHDANYALLYSLYKLNTYVSGCVHKWAGGVTGPGWRITTMDPVAKATDALKAEIQDIGRWLRNPNPPSSSPPCSTKASPIGDCRQLLLVRLGRQERPATRNLADTSSPCLSRGHR